MLIVLLVTVTCGLIIVFRRNAHKTDTSIKQPTRHATKTNNPVTLPKKPDIVGRAFGIAAGSGLPELNNQQLNERLDGIVSSGATWVRFDFDWSQIQPNNERSYNWSNYDRVVTAANARKLHVLGIINYTPGWARATACKSTNKCHPANVNAFASFAATVSNRYKDQGLHHWEIWNEPNNPNFWLPKADPAIYTQLLKSSYTALHTQDIEVQVITGGLSPQKTEANALSPIDFLNGVYAADGKNYFDAVAHHPYTFPLSPTSRENHAWAQMANLNQSLRATMVANNDGDKKVWITEFGAPTNGPGPLATVQNPNLAGKPYVVDQALQAKILSDAITQYRSYAWAGPFLYYSFQDSGTDVATSENFFGLITSDGAKKPAYTVFKEAASVPN